MPSSTKTPAQERREAESAPVTTEEQRGAAAAPDLAPPPAGGELVKAETALERYSRDPVISRISPKQFALIKRTLGVHASDDEIAWFLELAVHYDLDWAAREVWLAKSEPRNGREGKLLIMVGRDGLRKVAQRNGLEMVGDVVHEKDRYEVELVEDGPGGLPFHRVTHARAGLGAQRGPIVGSWARAVERHTRIERGWFEADLREYDPGEGASGYSPWKKQKSVMILAAAERQAARQATPLGGLLVEGEDEVIEATAADATGSDAWGLPPAAEAVLERARALGHAGLSDAPTARMTLYGQPEAAVEAWAERAAAELDDFERATAERAAEGAGSEDDPPDAEVVAEDELGPATAEQLDAEIALAEARAAGAANEREHEEAQAEVARLRELRAGTDEAQGNLL
jgi:hypothetical protein